MPTWQSRSTSANSSSWSRASLQCDTPAKRTRPGVARRRYGIAVRESREPGDFSQSADMEEVDFSSRRIDEGDHRLPRRPGTARRRRSSISRRRPSFRPGHSRASPENPNSALTRMMRRNCSGRRTVSGAWPPISGRRMLRAGRLCLEQLAKSRCLDRCRERGGELDGKLAD